MTDERKEEIRAAAQYTLDGGEELAVELAEVVVRGNLLEMTMALAELLEVVLMEATGILELLA